MNNLSLRFGIILISVHKLQTSKHFVRLGKNFATIISRGQELFCLGLLNTPRQNLFIFTFMLLASHSKYYPRSLRKRFSKHGWSSPKMIHPQPLTLPYPKIHFVASAIRWKRFQLAVFVSTTPSVRKGGESSQPTSSSIIMFAWILILFRGAGRECLQIDSNLPSWRR